MGAEAIGGGQARENIETMEREHELEIQMVRELQAALEARELDAARDLFDRLEEFTNAHFLAEQLMMRLHAYSGYDGHVQEHDRLIAELREMRRALAGEEPADPKASAARLERWLVAHMETTDRALADYLESKAEPPSGSS
jgi:hemerythrin-like metal-binding protein